MARQVTLDNGWTVTAAPDFQPRKGSPLTDYDAETPDALRERGDAYTAQGRHAMAAALYERAEKRQAELDEESNT